MKREKALKHKIKNPNVLFRGPIADYKIIPCGEQSLRERPVIIGSGPAGLFCTYALAKMGYRPLLLERGEAVDVRVKDVEDFWKNGKLKSNSNVQFGEGGAGTFSDGKLNTLVHDKEGRGREVLEVFVKHGAPEQILYDNKPHIGTDILVDVVKNMRASIEKSGGEVRFHTKVSAVNFEEKDGEKALVSLEIQDTHTNEISVIPTELAVLAIGHSARDTFHMLHEKEIPMEAKSFAVGVRAEHLQTMIDESQYGSARKNSLPAMAKIVMEESNVPVIYHLDHCHSVELCLAAVDYGYKSVMIDAADLPLEKNIAAVKKVVEYAHAKGVHVEAEIGKIKSAGAEGYTPEETLARVEEAKRLVEETNVDALAVSIGSEHGFYKHEPKLNYDLLDILHSNIKVPLVLHGGSGIPEEKVRRAINGGIRKVNVGTHIRYTYIKSVGEAIEKMGAMTHTADIMEYAKKNVKEVVKEWMRICENK